jgi:hypothetical protein
MRLGRIPGSDPSFPIAPATLRIAPLPTQHVKTASTTTSQAKAWVAERTPAGPEGNYRCFSLSVSRMGGCQRAKYATIDYLAAHLRSLLGVSAPSFFDGARRGHGDVTEAPRLPFLASRLWLTVRLLALHMDAISTVPPPLRRLLRKTCLRSHAHDIHSYWPPDPKSCSLWSSSPVIRGASAHE